MKPTYCFSSLYISVTPVSYKTFIRNIFNEEATYLIASVTEIPKNDKMNMNYYFIWKYEFLLQFFSIVSEV